MHATGTCVHATCVCALQQGFVCVQRGCVCMQWGCVCTQQGCVHSMGVCMQHVCACNRFALHTCVHTCLWHAFALGRGLCTRCAVTRTLTHTCSCVHCWRGQACACVRLHAAGVRNKGLRVPAGAGRVRFVCLPVGVCKRGREGCGCAVCTGRCVHACVVWSGCVHPQCLSLGGYKGEGEASSKHRALASVQALRAGWGQDHRGVPMRGAVCIPQPCRNTYFWHKPAPPLTHTRACAPVYAASSRGLILVMRPLCRWCCLALCHHVQLGKLRHGGVASSKSPQHRNVLGGPGP